jgi:[ribosomal protein S5]-alanine N-acetyltransferase
MPAPRPPRPPVPELANERVRLRPVLPADAADIVDISFYDGVAAASPADALAMLALIDADQARGASLHWGICLPGDDAVIGTIGYYRGFAGGVGEVGYVLRAPFRGRGIMTAALELVADHGLRRLGLTAVVAHTDAGNAASIALLRRTGFVALPSAGPQLTFERRGAPGGGVTPPSADPTRSAA